MTRPAKSPVPRPRNRQVRPATAEPPPRSVSPAGAGEAELEPGLRELRSSIANLRAAAEALAASADPLAPGTVPGSADAALLGAVIEEAERASRAVHQLTTILSGPGAMPKENGSGDAVPAARLAAELARRASAELDLVVHLDGPIDERLTVAQAFAGSILGALARLRGDFSVSEVELSVRRHSDLLSLEIAFAVREPESSRLREQHGRVLAGGPRGEPALGAAARAAGGEAWLSIRRGEATFSLRLLLPLGPAG